MWWGRILTVIGALATVAGCGHGGSVSPVSAGPSGACRSDLRLLLGACVPPAIAEQACGAASIATLDGCAARPACGPGRARDLANGQCVPVREVRALATSLGMLVDEDQTVECPDGGELATAYVDEGTPGPRLGCLPPSRPRAVTCPASSLADRAGACVRVSEGGRVDAVRWLQAAIGSEGGPGASPLCSALEQGAGALAVNATVEVRVELGLEFPDNDVSQVIARVQGSGAAVRELEHVLAPFVEALRMLGGTANQASITAAVHCHRRSERPLVQEGRR